MIRINLAPADARRPRTGLSLPVPSFNLGLVFGILYILAAGGIGYWWWSLSGQESRLAAENDRAAKEVETLKATLGQGTNLKAQIAEAKKRLEVLQEVTQGQERPVVLLNAFVDTVPRDLWITSFEDKGAVLKVGGTAFSTKSVSEFMSNLRQSGKFKDVEIAISRQDLAKTPSTVTFEVTCRFES